MKKISTKIALMVLISILISSSAISGFIYFNSKKLMTDVANEDLKSILSEHSQGIEKEITAIETLTTTLISVIDTTMPIRDIKDNSEAIDAYEVDISPVLGDILLSSNLKSGWAIFNSDFLSGGHTLSFTNEGSNYMRHPEYDVIAEGYAGDA